MRIRILLFVVAQLAACAYALRRGGAPERWTAWMMAAAALVTALLPYHPGVSFHQVEWAQLGVDAVLLAGLTVLALRADRFWPLWVAAVQLLSIAVHGVRAYDPSILPAVYNRAIGDAGYLMILLLAIGTLRHHRRLASSAHERDWSPLIWW